MKDEIWFVVASQHLYGDEVLQQVEKNTKKITSYLETKIKVNIKLQPVMTNKEDINNLVKEVNFTNECVGVIIWAHTFSPAKMWIHALDKLQKPLLHLHTQLNNEIPYETIDMDYMNLHQSAHGDRELAYAISNSNASCTTVVGHYQDGEVLEKIENWYVASCAIKSSEKLRIVRFGDNMNCVADTDGNKVIAEKKLGWTINTVDTNELVKVIEKITKDEVDQLIDIYKEEYSWDSQCVEGKTLFENVFYQARLELGIKLYLVQNNYQAFTTNFDNLCGLDQLPGLAVQRLMADGYGFGAEGDWRTAGLVYLFKQMSENINTSFMEDYTYDFEKGLILQSHMLEVCPTIAAEKPKILVEELSIGGKKAPARLVFTGKIGEGITGSLIEKNGELRLIINKVDVVSLPKSMPNLPVAATFWKPRPSLKLCAEAWLMLGGAHHTAYSGNLNYQTIEIFTKFYGIDIVLIDENLDVKNIERGVRL